MDLSRVQLGHAVTFIKYLASVVSLIFPPKTLFPINASAIKCSEFCRPGGKRAYEEYL